MRRKPRKWHVVSQADGTKPDCQIRFEVYDWLVLPLGEWLKLPPSEQCTWCVKHYQHEIATRRPPGEYAHRSRSLPQRRPH